MPCAFLLTRRATGEWSNRVGKVILGMTMSLDGFVNDRDGSVASLYPDLEALRETEPLREAIRTTGAVVMGWNAFAMAEDPDSYAGNYEFQVPIFVLTREVPRVRPREAGTLSFTFVTDDIESAIKKARAAAGNRNVAVIGGASTARQCLGAGLADELEIDIMPVLLCGGLRLFGDDCGRQTQLERLNVMELPGGRTHLRFRVVKP
jgi:dihydrofolate reductase